MSHCHNQANFGIGIFRLKVLDVIYFLLFIFVMFFRNDLDISAFKSLIK